MSMMNELCRNTVWRMRTEHDYGSYLDRVKRELIDPSHELGWKAVYRAEMRLHHAVRALSYATSEYTI